MRMRWLAIATFALMFSGCGSPDDDRLDIGLQCRTWSGSDELNVVLTDEGGGFVSIPVGTRVEVVGDNGDPEKATRPITVKVIEGKHEGLLGRIDRLDLAPIPKKD